MNCIAYLRVSTFKQEVKDLSIPAQRNICIKYARDRGYNVIREFSEHESATSVKGRDAFQEAMEFALDRRNNVQAFIVYDTSRFARNREDAIVYKKLLRKKGIQILYATQTINDDLDGNLVEGVLELFDERYSKVLGQVTLRGMKENARRGFANGSIPPYGYKFIRVNDERGNPKSKFSPLKHEAANVRKVFELCLRGYGMRNTIDELEEMGLRARNGKRFTKGLIESILHNEVYTGTLKFADVRVPNAHLAIIDMDTFQRAQEILMERKARIGGPGYPAAPYIFSGMLQCSKCGEKLIAEKVFRPKKKYTYYVCSGMKNKKNSCTGIRVRTTFLDQFLKDRIMNRILSVENYQYLCRRVMEYLSKFRRDSTKKVEILKREIAFTKKKIDNVVEAIAEGVIDRSLAKEKLDVLNKEKLELEAQAFQSGSSPVRDFKFSWEFISPVITLIRDSIEKKKPLELRNFLKGFIQKIVVTPTGVKVHYNPLYMVMSNKPGSSLFPMLAPRAGLEPAT